MASKGEASSVLFREIIETTNKTKADWKDDHNGCIPASTLKDLAEAFANVAQHANGREESE